MGLRSKQGGVPTRKVNLREMAKRLGQILDAQDLNIYLFGSRRHVTGSVRSDIDLLVQLPRRITRDEAQRIWKAEPYLDVFVLDGNRAESIVNESQLRSVGSQPLIEMLDAVCLVRDGIWQEACNGLRLQLVLSHRNPQASMVDLYELGNAAPSERADILVVTALTKEYAAVLSAINMETDEPSVMAELNDNFGGSFTMRVVNLHEMGSVGAALKTAEALQRSKASHVVLVGICGGIPRRAQLLDVVIPESVIYYEPGKTAPRGVESAYQMRDCDSVARKRLSSLGSPDQSYKVRADGELMACGEKVIADRKTRNRLARSHRKLTAIDMESYGVLRAAEHRKIPATIIKSICDLADRKKSDVLHDQARAAAAQVLVQGVRARAFQSEI